MALVLATYMLLMLKRENRELRRTMFTIPALAVIVLAVIYIYPSLKGFPHGKLRLVYECNPMSFIVEQAGGMATDGYTRILDIEPHELHQRTPIFIGSSEMVLKAKEFLENCKDD